MKVSATRHTIARTFVRILRTTRRPAPPENSRADDLRHAYRLMLTVAAAGRQGNSAQEPEPDLLPDQRRRPRSHSRRRGHDDPPRPRLVLRVLPRPRAVPHARRDAVRHAAAGRRREGRSGVTRPPDAVALEQPDAAHRLAGQPDGHAVPAGDWRRRSRAALRAGRAIPDRESRLPRRRGGLLFARRRRDERRRVLGVAEHRLACGSCPSSTWSKTTATRSRCPSKRRRPAAPSRRWSIASRT